ncbi:molybdenum cofactor biosynthesis protein B [Halioxenophilus aromaticivorans]|uniref:Molybdenum cofactor biosynthesis protein B n=1 Tax=Halioxenophilus aromaticivorans TaxID=1306992 RepID=A0AAV3U9H5_9ALTE
MSSSKEFTPLNIAVLTISDTRTDDTDTSGDLLKQHLTEAGHQFAVKTIVKDDIYQIRKVISDWVANGDINAILTTGGTGFAGRDSTPEAIAPLFDQEIVGFGELFRQVSYAEVGSSTVQSRCLAGVANKTIIFCLPGSNNACTTGWQKIIKEQLDSRHRPCNFVGQLL